MGKLRLYSIPPLPEEENQDDGMVQNSRPSALLKLPDELLHGIILLAIRHPNRPSSPAEIIIRCGPCWSYLGRVLYISKQCQRLQAICTPYLYRALAFDFFLNMTMADIMGRSRHSTVLLGRTFLKNPFLIRHVKHLTVRIDLFGTQAEMPNQEDLAILKSLMTMMEDVKQVKNCPVHNCFPRFRIHA
jgi:hypothetical protein